MRALLLPLLFNGTARPRNTRRYGLEQEPPYWPQRAVIRSALPDLGRRLSRAGAEIDPVARNKLQPTPYASGLLLAYTPI